MSLRNSWSAEEIVEAIKSPRLTFATLQEAESFRFACYSLRRRKSKLEGYTTGYGIGYSFVRSEELDDNGNPVFVVSILKTPKVSFIKEKV